MGSNPVSYTHLVSCEQVEDAEVIVTAYGSTARIVRSAIALARAEGIKAGMVRPITVWPFPSKVMHDAACREQVKGVLTVEMSAGQMVEDVRLAVDGGKPVDFYGRTGGVVPEPRDILAHIRAIAGRD